MPVMKNWPVHIMGGSQTKAMLQPVGLSSFVGSTTILEVRITVTIGSHICCICRRV